MVSQHVKNISTLSDEQNESLLRLVEREMEETNEEQTRLPPAPEQMVTRGRKAKQVTAVESVLVAGGEGDGMDEEDVARIMNLGVTGNADDLGKYRDCEDPKTFRQAMKLPDHELWQAAIDAEIAALTDNKTWKVVKRPKIGKVLKSNWVFTKKKKSDGSIERYKARAVACGNEQVYGRHYDVVFSAVVDMTVIKLLLAIAATWNVDAIHADAPNAYVQAELGDDYDIYMELPRGMRLTREILIDSKVDQGDDVVLKLRKSLYGLKQAGRLWSEFLSKKLE